MADKKYQFTLAAQCVVEGEDAPKMFDGNVVYHNLSYEDVVLIEKHLLNVFTGLNQFAEAKVASLKKA